MRHDAAHVMAQAVQELFPGTQVTIGPAIENGFYYDFARDEPFSTEDFETIEARMTEIIERDLDFVREVWDRDKAIAYFKSAGEDYKAELVAAFSHLSISTYASQFDGYSGQSFVTRGEKPGQQNTVLVKTQILDPGSDPVDLTYVTRRIKGQWRILDVLLDGGISELAVRRSEYRRVLKTGGINALISTLNAKAGQLLAE